MTRRNTLKLACIIKELLNFNALFSQIYSEKLQQTRRLNQSLIVPKDKVRTQGK